MIRANPSKRIGAVSGGWISLLVGCFWSVATAAAPVMIEDITFTAQPGAQLEVRLTFNEPPSADIESYTIEEPARIVFDFPDTKSGLEQKRFSLSQANTTSVMVLESGDRTRMIVNLVDLVPFESAVSGRQLTLMIGQEGGQAMASSAATDILRNDANRVERVVSEITDLAFQRSPDGEGLLILSLTNPSVDASIFREGGDIALQFLNTNIREALIRRFDVTDFATPVQGIEVSTTERGTKLKLRADGLYDYLAYQTGNEYILAVAALSEEEKRERLNEFDYVGDRISLNFQSIEVRAVLQLIADFTELNLVASDSVTGSITLRLQNVPWDQALDLVLKTRGLDSRQIGSVLMVAPAQEIAERERQEVEANKQLAELAPLQSEFIRIRYAKAIDVVGLFEAGRRRAAH